MGSRAAVSIRCFDSNEVARMLFLYFCIVLLINLALITNTGEGEWEQTLSVMVLNASNDVRSDL